MKVFWLNIHFVNDQKLDVFTAGTMKQSLRNILVFLLFVSASDESMEKGLLYYWNETAFSI